MYWIDWSILALIKLIYFHCVVAITSSVGKYARDMCVVYSLNNCCVPFLWLIMDPYSERLQLKDMLSNYRNIFEKPLTKIIFRNTMEFTHTGKTVQTGKTFWEDAYSACPEIYEHVLVMPAPKLPDLFF